MFGRVPAELSGALFKSESLGDVPDKAAARKNLGVPSIEEVMYAGVPVGTIIHFYGTIAPAGFLVCMGQTITSAAFPNLVDFLNPGGASAVLPDLRGEFLRGLDVGRNLDPGRALASKQNMGPLGTNATVSNAALLICIKAYDAVRNMNAQLDIAALVADQASTLKITDFTGTNQSLAPRTGYQKMAGGILMQWGYVQAIQGQNLDLVSSGSQNDNVLALSVNFPVAFQNACTSVHIGLIDQQEGEVNVFNTTKYGKINQNSNLISPSALTKTSFNAAVYQTRWNTVPLSNFNFSYIAMGY